MRFDVPGYLLKFIQKEPSRDDSAHEFTYIHKFYSPVTGYNYILRADYHKEDVFAINFMRNHISMSTSLHSRVEVHQNTQRYRIYKELVKEKIGEMTFEHVDYQSLSGYLLLNRAAINLKEKESAILTMFAETYNNLLDV